MNIFIMVHLYSAADLWPDHVSKLFFKFIEFLCSSLLHIRIFIVRDNVIMPPVKYFTVKYSSHFHLLTSATWTVCTWQDTFLALTILIRSFSRTDRNKRMSALIGCMFSCLNIILSLKNADFPPNWLCSYGQLGPGLLFIHGSSTVITYFHYESSRVCFHHSISQSTIQCCTVWLKWGTLLFSATVFQMWVCQKSHRKCKHRFPGEPVLSGQTLPGQ